MKKTIKYVSVLALMLAPIVSAQVDTAKVVSKVTAAKGEANSSKAIQGVVNAAIKGLSNESETNKKSDADVQAVVKAAINALGSSPADADVMAVVNGALKALGATSTNYALVAGAASAALGGDAGSALAIALGSFAVNPSDSPGGGDIGSIIINTTYGTLGIKTASPK